MKFLTKRRAHISASLLIFALALTLRALTANFIAAHFTYGGWFQEGTYAIFDREARDVLDGRGQAFWIGDTSRTELAIYPPGFRLWIALIYGLGGERSPAAVQRVQVLLDALSVLLVVGVGVTAYGWGAGLGAGFLAALSPLLALSGATPMADAPASWLVLAGVWMFLLGAKRKSVGWSACAGAALGLACWLRVNPLFLGLAWAVASLLFVQTSWRRRAQLGAAAVLAAAVVISPVIIRNLIVFRPAVMLTGLGVGVNMWAGIAETERGAEFGGPHPYSDALLTEKERREAGVAPDVPFGLYWPDGIRRDRERVRRSLAVIREHPFWYAGVMARRAALLFKYAGEPSPWVGTSGFNVTSRKCLPESWRGGVFAPAVNLLGMAQSVARHVQLPLILCGVWLALRRDWRTAALLLATVIYYVTTLSVGHAETRYSLPMQYVLLVFAGLAASVIAGKARRALRRRRGAGGAGDQAGGGEGRPA